MQSLDCRHCAARVAGFFGELSQAGVARCNHHTTNVYKAGQVLFYEGNQAFGVYCIYAGRIKLYKTGHGGRLQIVRLAETGDVLGYRSLFADEPYTATAEAIEDATVCFIEKAVFLSLLAQEPTLALRMIRKLAQELRQAEDRMTSIAQKPVKERLAELLLLLHASHGEERNGATVIALSLTREELAEMIGTTQETIIRLLSEWKSTEILDVSGREIAIRNLQTLRRIARIEV